MFDGEWCFNKSIHPSIHHIIHHQIPSQQKKYGKCRQLWQLHPVFPSCFLSFFEKKPRKKKRKKNLPAPSSTVTGNSSGSGVARWRQPGRWSSVTWRDFSEQHLGLIWGSGHGGTPKSSIFHGEGWLMMVSLIYGTLWNTWKNKNIYGIEWNMANTWNIHWNIWRFNDG